MTYTNVTIYNDAEERLRKLLAEAERTFWAAEASNLRMTLENIPEAVAKYGYVTISSRRGENVTLIEKPADADGEVSP